MTATAVIAGIVFLLAYMGLVLGLRSFCRWAVAREEARHHAATFEADFIPQVADVAAQEEALGAAERVVLEVEICDIIDASMPLARKIGEAVRGQ